MNNASIEILILSNLSIFAGSVLVIIGNVLTLGIGYLVFKFGWDRLIHDQSLMIGGYYLRNTPYKGYNRFKSQKWNMEHTS